MASISQSQVTSPLESPRYATHPLVIAQTAKDVWVLLVALRCINALCIKTFFQPDEYYQVLEPAWQLAFGPESGAWITWEWHHGLRSSLHPVLFAGIFYLGNTALRLLQCFPQFRATVLSVLPNLFQALCASAGDYYTWQLAQRLYGTRSDIAWTALLMTIFSPWQWFCSTRTFSNNLEMTLTIAAMYYWPWESYLGSGVEVASLSTTSSAPLTARNLRISLLLASFACILRPTNLLIWFPVLMPIILQYLPGVSQLMPLGGYHLGSRQSAATDKAISGLQSHVLFYVMREALIVGGASLLLSAISDYLYFKHWVFPPYQWLKFNISQDLAVFYGRNDWHYYLSQGLPLLLTTYLPFSLVALYKSFDITDPKASKSVVLLFTTVVLTVLGTLSLISHKEVRFIYPLLPILHIITAPTISAFFTTTRVSKAASSSFQYSVTAATTIRRKRLMAAMLLSNLSIAFYVSRIHQSGVIPVMRYLRQEYEDIALDYRGIFLSSPLATRPPKHSTSSLQIPYDDSETFVAFLMPCHSVPWRSHLFYSSLKAWALTCEPPLHLAAAGKTQQREAYMDEADRFYDDPRKFLREEVNTKERPWPRYVVGFEGVGAVLREWYEGEGGLEGWKVRERWRTRNSQWHDDWRRQGDVVVWDFVDESHGIDL